MTTTKKNDPDEWLMVPADFEIPPRAVGLTCACGALEICRCDGLGNDQEVTPCHA